MADIKQLERALINADAAGDADAARAFAAEIVKARAAEAPKASAEKASDSSMKAFGAGLGKGFGQVALNAQKFAGKGLDAVGLDSAGQWLVNDADKGMKKLEGELAPYKAQSPIAAGAGEFGGNIIATLPVGGVLAKGVRAVAPGAVGLSNALATGGMRAGVPAVAAPGANLLRRAAVAAPNMLTRMVGGGATGTVAAGLINPEEAATGGVIGAALPPVVAGAGKIGHAVGQRFAATQVPESVRASVEAARNAGYVIPPSQAKPTMVNKALEGFAGKITTAQNASAKNQAVTNSLVKKAIGAKDLTPEALAEVRNAANAAYDELGRVGAFQTDDAFRESLKNAGSISAQMRKDFPELVNKEVDDLVEGLSGRGEFDAQSAIEAIKQFRFSGSSNRAAQDPAKKALGKAQMKIAGALEDLIDRNLQATGAQDLLTNYRAARQTLAKVYDVEKALNTASGNIDAKKLGAALAKGRPLTGELRDVAEFANQFPKAAQMTERMGSLPQVSPLDFGALGTMSALTSNPLLMAGVLARPAARSLVLSNAVQNRLATQPAAQNRLMELLSNPAAEQLLYRSAPAVAASR